MLENISERHSVQQEQQANEKFQTAGAINRPNLDWIITIKPQPAELKQYQLISTLYRVFYLVLSCNLPTIFGQFTSHSPPLSLH